MAIPIKKVKRLDNDFDRWDLMFHDPNETPTIPTEMVETKPSIQFVDTVTEQIASTPHIPPLQNTPTQMDQILLVHGPIQTTPLQIQNAYDPFTEAYLYEVAKQAFSILKNRKYLWQDVLNNNLTIRATSVTMTFRNNIKDHLLHRPDFSQYHWNRVEDRLRDIVREYNAKIDRNNNRLFGWLAILFMIMATFSIIMFVIVNERNEEKSFITTVVQILYMISSIASASGFGYCIYMSKDED